MTIANLDDLDFYASQPSSGKAIGSILEACRSEGIYQLHANGYDLKISECELVWKPLVSRSAHIFGLESSELPHRWFLVNKRRQIEIDMQTLHQAIKKAWLLQSDSD